MRASEDLRQVLPEEPGQLPAGGGEGLRHLSLLKRGVWSGRLGQILAFISLGCTNQMIWDYCEMSRSQYEGGRSKEAAPPSKEPERAKSAKPDSHWEGRQTPWEAPQHEADNQVGFQVISMRR